MVTRRRLLPLLFLFAFAACGGLGSHDELTDAKIAVMEEMVEVLEGVTDRQSAEDAKPKIHALAKRAREINKAEKELGAPSAEEKERSAAKLSAVEAKLATRMQTTMTRLAENPEASQALEEVLLETRPDFAGGP